MLKKLRRRFVLVAMSLITAVLLIVFFALLYFNYQRLSLMTDQALERALMSPPDGVPESIEIGRPDRREPDLDVLSFTVFLDEDEEEEDDAIRLTSRGGIFISEDTLRAAVDAARASDKDRGTIEALSLRYRKAADGRGTRIGFADTSRNTENLRSLILIALAVGIPGWIALFFITVFLSRQIVRPVEQAWAAQRRFIADASHELKTPLTVILANLELLLSHRDAPLSEGVRWLTSSRDEAVRMKGLVEDMLFLARSDSGREETVMSEVALSDAVMNTLLSFEPVAFENGVSLDSEIAPDLTVQGDASQLRRLIAILLDNAVKYAGDGGRVFVSLTSGGGTAALRVENTGAVIAPEDAGHIFERFYRADPSRNSERGGYGLGLPIAKEIAEHHGAVIRLVPDETGKTVFQVNFRL